MVKAVSGTRAEEARQAAEHRLFVEGGPESFDRQAVRELLRDTGIRVDSLGPSYSLKDVADSLHPHHPRYYFLIDRDYRDKKTVDQSWAKFPDSETSNLLIWRRREIENYFLDPDYLARSEYLACSTGELKKCIMATARKRVFLDAANFVIIVLREELKKNWIEIFRTTTGFETRRAALKKLVGRREFGKMVSGVKVRLGEAELRERFDRTVEEFCGRKKVLSWGAGKWIEMISGRHVLPTVISKCFKVRDARGNALHGNERMLEVVKDLMRKPLPEQPQDFRELHRLIEGIVR